MSYQTFDGIEIREEVYEKVRAGDMTLDEAGAIELYLKKLEYRTKYNKRPEVRAKRKAYNRKRNETAKIGRQLLGQLLKDGRDGGDSE